MALLTFPPRKGERILNLGTDANFILQGIGKPSVEKRIYNTQRRDVPFSDWHERKIDLYLIKDLFFTFGFLATWITANQFFHVPDAGNVAFSALTLKKLADACFDRVQYLAPPYDIDP